VLESDNFADGADPIWRVPRAEDDLFLKFLRRAYFPVLRSWPKLVLLAWLIVFGVSITFGPKFLSQTRSNLSLPEGTPSTEAIRNFKISYPSTTDWPPIFVVQTSRSGKGDILGGASMLAAETISNFTRSHGTGIVSAVSGYWELINVPGLAMLAQQAVSPSRNTLVTSLYFSDNTTLKDIQEFVKTMLHTSQSSPGWSTPELKVGVTGLFALFGEMSEDTEKQFLTVDATVLPIAIVILGWRLRSYRHMLIEFCNLAAGLLLVYAFLVPISNALDINPFAPVIMNSLGIAVCFDYTLFMLMRFREELIEHRLHREDAVFTMLESSGHVVLLSGATLTATFVLLIFLPQDFLTSTGWTCGMVIATSMIANFTITPAMLLACRCFSVFEPLPTCCCPAKLITFLHLEPVTVQPHAPANGNAPTSAGPAEPIGGEIAAEIAVIKVAADVPFSVAPPPPVEEKAPAPSAKPNRSGSAGLYALLSIDRPMLRLSWELSRDYKRWGVLAFILVVSIPLGIEVRRLKPTSDDNLIFLRRRSMRYASHRVSSQPTMMRASFLSTRLRRRGPQQVHQAQ
jgi:hypothetical protein